jgi:surface antigen
MYRWNGFWSRHLYPAISGDAWSWASSARSLGYPVQSTPATQAVVVFPKSAASPLGHVAWVDAMAPRSDGTYIHIWEMNVNGLGVIDQRWVKVTPGLSFITAPAI